MIRACFLVIFLSLPAMSLADLAPLQVLAKGKIVDADGKPVSGAIAVGSLSQTNSSDGYDTPADENGVFTAGVHNDHDYKSVRLCGYAKGYSDSEFQIVPVMGKPGYHDLVLVMRPAVSFTITVKDDASAAIPNAKVEFAEGTWPTWSTQPLIGKLQPVDAEGKIVLPSMYDAGALHLNVTADGYLATNVWDVKVKKGSQSVVLHKGGIFNCKVVDVETGKPLANMDVTLPYMNNAKFKTDADGIFHAPDVPFGSVRLAFPNSGYTYDWTNALGGFKANFPADSLDKLHMLKVRHDYVIEGNVVDKLGAGLAGATVELEDAEPNYRNHLDSLGAQTTSDAKGHFRFDKFSVDHFTLQVSGKFVSKQMQMDFTKDKGPYMLVTEPNPPKISE